MRTLSVVLVKRDHFVDNLHGCIATSLGLSDQLRVPTLLNDEIENVEHVGCISASSRCVLVGIQVGMVVFARCAV